MIVYRITKRKLAGDISGTGAATYGGRWNKKGCPVLYTGESKEIALLETIVHSPPMLIQDLDIVTLEIPDNSISIIQKSDLPTNWFNYPAPTILSSISEEWILHGKTIALKVPSCIIHSAHNHILNCRHSNYNKVKLLERREFYFESRLMK